MSQSSQHSSTQRHHAAHGLQRPFLTADEAAQYDAAYQAWPARCAAHGPVGSPAWVGWQDAGQIAAGSIGMDDMAAFAAGVQ